MTGSMQGPSTRVGHQPTASQRHSSQDGAGDSGKGLPSRAATARSTFSRPPVSTRPASPGTGSTELSRACLHTKGAGKRAERGKRSTRWQGPCTSGIANQ